MTNSILKPHAALPAQHQPSAVTKAVDIGPMANARWTTAGPCCRNLLHAFRATGGIVSGDALALLLRARSTQPLSLLAHWIVDRQVLSFECHAQTLLPMFQFDPAELVVQSGLQPVMMELGDVFDDRELVNWFGTPNCWLSGASPVAVFANDHAAVLHAARADRFVITG